MLWGMALCRFNFNMAEEGEKVKQNLMNSKIKVRVTLGKGLNDEHIISSHVYLCMYVCTMYSVVVEDDGSYRTNNYSFTPLLYVCMYVCIWHDFFKEELRNAA